MFKPDKTYVFALGGLGEVGKNMYCFLHNNEIVIVDAGVLFPDAELRGIDYVLPDFSFLKKNQKLIRSVIITHGHEDHIGAIPFLLQEINIPSIYAPNQAAYLIRKKLEERNINYKYLHLYDDNTKLKYKYFEVEFFRTTHSVPDSFGISITSPNGTIIATGDFKFDLTPIGPDADIYKMAMIGKKGVTLLLSDSTNALDEGFSSSESKVDIALNDIFTKHPNNRLIIATFASNIYRLKHIIETCKKHNRKVCLMGRSMENNVEISIESGYIKAKDTIVSIDVAKTLKPSEVVLLCTGSQGEPLAALSRIADGSHRLISLIPDDVVIFSSSAIPGNAISISNTINNLYLKGIKVYTSTSLNDIHTSGHGKQEELKLMLKLINPKYFMPVHGDYRMLKKHASLAVDCGINEENTFVLDNGDVLEIDNNTITKVEAIEIGDTFVDGNRIGDVSGAVMHDRKVMASDGILVIIANINMEKRKLFIKPNITTRGFVQINENEELLKKIENMAEKTITKCLKSLKVNFLDIKTELTKTISSYIYDITERKPLVMTVLLDIKN